MNTISVSKFKATCLEQFETVARTRRMLVITKRGKPIADIVPHGAAPSAKKVFGCMRGSVLMYGDIVSPVVPEGEWDACK